MTGEPYLDLARDLVAEIEAIARDAWCDCDNYDLDGWCDCSVGIARLQQLADEAKRRLWLAELEADRAT